MVKKKKNIYISTHQDEFQNKDYIEKEGRGMYYLSFQP